MVAEFNRCSPTPEALTSVYRLSAEKVHNPNVVKTMLAPDGRALYGFRSDVLQRWNSLPHSPLEHTEKLEQLRLIEAGIRIGIFWVEGESLYVDTAEQLEQALAIAACINAHSQHLGIGS